MCACTCVCVYTHVHALRIGPKNGDVWRSSTCCAFFALLSFFCGGRWGRTEVRSVWKAPCLSPSSPSECCLVSPRDGRCPVPQPVPPALHAGTDCCGNSSPLSFEGASHNSQ